MRGLAAELGRLEDAGGRAAGIDPGVARDPGRRRGGVGGVPLGHAPGPARLGRHGPAGRAPRRPGGPPGAGGQPGRVPGGPAAPRPVRAGRHGARRRWDSTGRSAACARRAAGRIETALAAERRAAGLPGLPARAGPRPLARRPAPLGKPRVGDARRGDRGVLRARAAADLPPGLRAAVPHPDARRHRAARAAAGGPAAARRDSRWSSASTSARSRSAATWRSWPPTSRRSARPASSASPMYYRGAADAHFVPLCPVVIRPQHWVAEEVVDELGRDAPAPGPDAAGAGHGLAPVPRRQPVLRRGRPADGGRRRAGLVPAGRPILFPRLTARIRKPLGRIVQTPPLTRLQLERTTPTPGPENGHVGFTRRRDDRHRRAAAARHRADLAVRPAGAAARPRLEQPEQPARLGLQLRRLRRRGRRPERPGHGPDPQRPAGPRAAWPSAGSSIPGGDGLRRRLPQHLQRLGRPSSTSTGSPSRTARNSRRSAAIIEQACDRNAHERCRRFMSAPLTLSFAGARQHVEERAEDLAQTRPEWGHATNAITHRRPPRVDPRPVPRPPRLPHLLRPDPGRRRGYHPDAHPRRPSSPSAPGINLEYYFSYVDNPGWGCGTKLPHNIAALLGVMDGAASDLRTGLPWQMVEIHEPVRSLFIIETTPEAMLRIMDRNAGIGRLCRNGWVQLAVLDPETRADQRLPATAVPTPTSRRPRSLPRPPPRSTGIAAGAITWSSPRSRP